ncbi:MAG: DUF1292 domain-containing protein [Candidatus Obscuribacterales bacterium]|nr:DUF1292 domain-containing protein [Candidatus Obscuribacterales bacterium]
MTNEPPPTQEDDAIITLEGEDGTSHTCQILDILDFEGNKYGILIKKADDGGTEEESLVIMRLIQKDDQSVFRTIESDEEFEKVVAYVEEIARAAAASQE